MGITMVSQRLGIMCKCQSTIFKPNYIKCSILSCGKKYPQCNGVHGQWWRTNFDEWLKIIWSKIVVLTDIVTDNDDGLIMTKTCKHGTQFEFSVTYCKTVWNASRIGGFLGPRWWVTITRTKPTSTKNDLRLRIKLALIKLFSKFLDNY
jgi:hypothetical protein